MTARVALLVGGDLMARARLEQAAARHGFELRSAGPEGLDRALAATTPELLVLDLDSGGSALLEDLARVRAQGTLGVPVVGYFSHVDEQLGRRAAEAGCEAYPRGRFWRSLDELLERARRGEGLR